MQLPVVPQFLRQRTHSTGFTALQTTLLLSSLFYFYIKLISRYVLFGCVSRCLVVCPEERSPWRTIDPSSHPQKRSPHPILAKKGKTGSILRNLLVSTGYTYYARSLQAAGLQFASRKPLWSKATCICMHSMLISTSGLREATEAPAYGCDL